jgi:hypothetical protein
MLAQEAPPSHRAARTGWVHRDTCGWLTRGVHDGFTRPRPKIKPAQFVPNHMGQFDW